MMVPLALLRAFPDIFLPAARAVLIRSLLLTIGLKGGVELAKQPFAMLLPQMAPPAVVFLSGPESPHSATEIRGLSDWNRS